MRNILKLHVWFKVIWQLTHLNDKMLTLHCVISRKKLEIIWNPLPPVDMETPDKQVIDQESGDSSKNPVNTNWVLAHFLACNSKNLKGFKTLHIISTVDRKLFWHETGLLDK